MSDKNDAFNAQELYSRLLKLDGLILESKGRAYKIIAGILMTGVTSDAHVETNIVRDDEADILSDISKIELFIAGFLLLSITRLTDSTFITRVNKNFVTDINLYLKSDSLGPLPQDILKHLNSRQENVEQVKYFIAEMKRRKANGDKELKNITIDEKEGSYITATNTFMNRVILRVLCVSDDHWEVYNE